MDTLLQDIRYALRTLRRSRGFAAVAVITLALGIGANTAMFSIVNAVLLRPVPYNNPERLLKLYTSMPQFREASVSYPNFLDWQRRSRSFDLMAAYRHDSFNLTGQANPERLRGEMASATIFPLLGIKPIIGRTFTEDEDRRGAAPVVVLTSSLWKRRFGANPKVLGSSITLNNNLYTVIGVVPGDDVELQRVSVIIPIGQWSEPLFQDRGVGMGMRVVGRLKAGVSQAQAQSELDSIAAGLAREFPKEDKNRGIYSISMREDMVGDVRTPLLVLLAAVGFVLLIACANVANLLLARSSSRRREFAVRGALGASPVRIMRQLLTEGLLLALAGGALGLLVAFSLNGVFVSRVADVLPRADQVHLDSAVLAFTALISILASLLFGVTPALQSSRADLNETLKEAGRGTTRRHGLQRTLVVVEVALGLVLAASAGLMIRTMSRLWSVNPGFDPNHVLTFAVAGSPAVHGTPAEIRNGFAATMQQLNSIPGVKAVSVVFGSLPMNGDSELPYWVEGRPKPPEQSQMDMALFYGIDAGYFSAMRIPLLRGRYLTPQDNEHTACVMDIDQDMARKAFPGQDPLGQHVNFDLLPMQCEVVGIVGHVKHWGLDADATSKVHSQMYIPFRQFPDSVMDLASKDGAYVLRTAGDPYSQVPAVKRVIGGVNGNMVMYDEESMQDLIKDSLAARRFTRLLLGVFAGLALALAAVGIYGVISYAVTQSTHEIGLRMALGASRWKVLGMVLSSAMRLALIGIGVGAVTALAATRALKGLLFDVSAADPITFAGVALVLAVVTLIASYIPAWRAARVDPMVALRYE
ncbi:MAG TPA: ABC transporter permease [Terriglobales bacterium]|nr:ABC transporter permease [Terriglobales bacterium]